MAKPTPFKINVPDSLLHFINQRVETARIPPPSFDLPDDKAWSTGVPPATIYQLQKYWSATYSWRSVEARINAKFRMFTLPITEAGETLSIHFVHHVSTRPDAIPLLFQHGWPGNFLEVEKIIDSLTDPPEGAQAYHVVAPSLPGFTFSEGPKSPEFRLKHMAAVDHKLMLALGYEKYMAQGGDWGSMIVRIMACDFPEHCVAVHVNAAVAGPPLWWRYPLQMLYLIAWAPFQGKDSGLGRLMWWRDEESGYLEIQGTKPQALSYALVDSPVGMMAWIRDKMHPLVDEGCGFKWEDEDVITWAMVNIVGPQIPVSFLTVSGSYTSSQGHPAIAIYTEMPRGLALNTSRKISSGDSFPKKWILELHLFPKDVLNIPRWWAAVTISYNIVFWKEHTSGGHFAATEKPAELVQDIRDFTRVLSLANFAALKESGKLKK